LEQREIQAAALIKLRLFDGFADQQAADVFGLGRRA
jgi:hypothetical protein